MNPFKKLQYYFIGGALAKTEDVFEKVKAEVLFNFTAFFILTNLPYLFVAANKAIHLAMGASTIGALILALVVIKKTNNVKMTTYFFLVNFTIQDLGHYIINNGRMEEQGILFSLLFVLCGFLLLDRWWGTVIGVFAIVMYVVGLYNLNNGLSLWHVPVHISDPEEKGNFKYLALIPLFLNMYLISEFVKARQKAERQLSEQKMLIEEKQKEILDSIRYARRIQRSLMPGEKFIEKTLERMNREKQ
ncbi:MAG TPA: hypothetical protein VNY73_06835 [Bacteroidia bacterium]|jgi:hypothetical protein|nr:hypothetical protein [Bacteroidia bacterium]